jgi:hypothetical protein
MSFADDLDTFLRAAAPPGHTSNKDIFDNVWKIVQECGEEERHFNTLQSVYRGVASSWLLATFGAVGFLLFDKDGHIAHPWMAAAVCILGSFGVSLLWMLDLHIYHRLLVAAFDQGLALESKFKWLPQIRNTMLKHTKGAVRKRLAWYYFFTTLGPAAAGIVLFCWHRYFWSALVAGGVWLAVAVFLLAKTRGAD